MPIHIEQYGHFQSVTEEREDGLFETTITDFKRKTSVKGVGKTDLEAYGNAVRKLNELE